MASPYSHKPAKGFHEQTDQLTTRCSLPEIFFFENRQNSAGLGQFREESLFR